jgi:hypothetical protein
MPRCVGWHRAVSVFLPGITQERRLKPPSPNLAQVGGGAEGISPYLILWRGTCPGYLSPGNGDTGST